MKYLSGNAGNNFGNMAVITNFNGYNQYKKKQDFLSNVIKNKKALTDFNVFR